MEHPIQHLLQNHKKGRASGICSVCSANRQVLAAAMRQAHKDGGILLIEATSNQVDQYGGYTGMTPSTFVEYVQSIAIEMQFPFSQIILGGDHLGPNVWQNRPAEFAMAQAREQIRAYVFAGFSKIHLDASMRCGDDPGDAHEPLDAAIVAGRAADLCAAAEEAFAERDGRAPEPVYVIGSEVPIPGGAQEKLSELRPTSVSDTAHTIAVNEEAFHRRGLEDAWQRVVAVVVQPGVEFGDDTVIQYDPEKSSDLAGFIERHDHLVYEAHSTDYQTRRSLRRMVEDHFAILKVGPWLTFAFREAVFALADIESEWLGSRKGVSLSGMKAVLDVVMRDNPKYWKQHYQGSETEVAFARKYSYSDRIRYYWPDPAVSRALDQLLNNLDRHPAPLSLVSQYLPEQYRAAVDGEVGHTAIDFVYHKIMQVIEIYSFATEVDRKDPVMIAP